MRPLTQRVTNSIFGKMQPEDISHKPIRGMRRNPSRSLEHPTRPTRPKHSKGRSGVPGGGSCVTAEGGYREYRTDPPLHGRRPPDGRGRRKRAWGADHRPLNARVSRARDSHDDFGPLLAHLGRAASRWLVQDPDILPSRAGNLDENRLEPYRAKGGHGTLTHPGSAHGLGTLAHPASARGLG